MPESSGDTLDLKRLRLTVAQFVTLFLLLIGAVTGATVTTVTTQETAQAVGEMHAELKAVAARLNRLNLTDARHDAEIDAIKEHARMPRNRRERRDTNPDDD